MVAAHQVYKVRKVHLVLQDQAAWPALRDNRALLAHPAHPAHPARVVRPAMLVCLVQ